MSPPDKFILFAEDDAVTAKLVMHALATLTPAPRVVHVRDGLEAMDFLQARGRFEHRPPGSPAVVLLDMNMPKLDGLGVLRQVRNHERLKTTPVVMLTSSQDEHDVLTSYQLGANAYVVKPVEFQKFFFVLRNLETFWLGVNQPPPDPWSLPVGAETP